MATEYHHLTAAFVRGAKPGDRGRRFIWDESAGKREGVKGLALVVTAKGHKSYALQYFCNGRARRMKLGDVGDWTDLDELRKYAGELKVMAKGGVDPMEVKHQRKVEAEEREREQEAKKEIPQTVEELADRYIADYAKPNKRTWKADQQRLKRHVTPALGKMAPIDVQRPHMKALYRLVADGSGKREAEHVRVLVMGVFTFAVEEQFLPADYHNPGRLPKRDRINRGKPKRRKRKLKADELPVLLKALTKLDKTDPMLASFYRVLMLTGLRSSEVRERRWEDLDREGRELYIGMTKDGESRIVPLSDAAIAALPDRIVGSPWIFPSPMTPRKKPVSQNHTINMWKRLLVAARAKYAETIEDHPDRDELVEAMLKDLRLHDLRHSVASELAAAKMDPRDIQKALGHQSLQTTMGYIHEAEHDAAREGLEDMAAKITNGSSK